MSSSSSIWTRHGPTTTQSCSTTSASWSVYQQHLYLVVHIMLGLPCTVRTQLYIVALFLSHNIHRYLGFFLCMNFTMKMARNCPSTALGHCCCNQVLDRRQSAVIFSLIMVVSTNNGRSTGKCVIKPKLHS